MAFSARFKVVDTGEVPHGICVIATYADAGEDVSEPMKLRLMAYGDDTGLSVGDVLTLTLTEDT